MLMQLTTGSNTMKELNIAFKKCKLVLKSLMFRYFNLEYTTYNTVYTLS